MAGELIYAFRIMRLPLLDAGGASIGRVDDIVVVPLPSAETGFGVAPGGVMTPEQLVLWRGRTPLYGATVGPYGAVSIVVQLRADDFREYAGLGGLRLKYDDGWFSATSVGGGDTGFVPPWSHCGNR